MKNRLVEGLKDWNCSQLIKLANEIAKKEDIDMRYVRKGIGEDCVVIYEEIDTCIDKFVETYAYFSPYFISGKVVSNLNESEYIAVQERYREFVGKDIMGDYNKYIQEFHNEFNKIVKEIKDKNAVITAREISLQLKMFGLSSVPKSVDAEREDEQLTLEK